MDGQQEPGYADEIERATVFENDGVVYPDSNAINPFLDPNGHFFRPRP